MPDGSTAYDVACFSGRWACSNEAASVCNGGPYVVLEEDTTLGMVTRDRQGSIRVQCTGDYLAAQRPDTSATPSGPQVSANDVVVCRKALGDVARTGPAWSAMRGRETREEAPGPQEFMKACTQLPARAQLCLNMIYREHHGKLCEETMSALSDDAKGKLDALFLRPLGAPPAPSVSGAILR
jgi:hypothetical protein